MTRKGFTLVEVMVASLILAVALLSLVGAVTWSAVNVSAQLEKNKAIYLSQLLLEEMKSRKLEEIISTDWDAWVKTNGYDFGLKDLQVLVSFPLVYEEEQHGYAYKWGYTYQWGYVWAGYYRPQLAKALLRVDVKLRWRYRDRWMEYLVSTIFSQISQG